MIRRMLALSLVALAMGAVLGEAVGAAGSATSGPSVTLDKTALAPGERVGVTIDGFKARYVTLSICGNAAVRSSSDCNLTASEGLGLDRDGSSTFRTIPVATPPTTCPCVLLASSSDFKEVATAPFELIGHPVGPVVGSNTDRSLTVTVDARRGSGGVVSSLRSALGGPTTYDVTVRVQNVSTVTAEAVTLDSVVTGRGSRDLVDMGEVVVPTLAPGATWQQDMTARVPAPVFGTIAFETSASGAGPAVASTASATYIPYLLILLLIIFIIDNTAMAWLWVTKRRERQAQARLARALAST